jgi:hypothetical protein
MTLQEATSGMPSNCTLLQHPIKTTKFGPYAIYIVHIFMITVKYSISFPWRTVDFELLNEQEIW